MSNDATADNNRFFHIFAADLASYGRGHLDGSSDGGVFTVEVLHELCLFEFLLCHRSIVRRLNNGHIFDCAA